jgi:hypothetical protein
VHQQLDPIFKLASARHLTSDAFHKMKNRMRFFNSTPKRDDLYCRGLLTQAQLTAIKQSGNNATLFIHGYNVSYGGHSNSFALTPDKELENLTVSEAFERLIKKPNIEGFTQSTSTLYRHPEQEVLQSYQNAEQYPADEINGDHAHSWWTHMNNNLNLATQQFEYKNYHQYTNVIGIAWQGDPEAWNFMADTDSAYYSAMLLTPLIEQLVNAGIDVNIIAHSMGNCVLMNLLNRIAEFNIKIKHAFLWEASIPDYCLSKQKHASDPNGTWHFPKAVDAAEKITVLYSNNDNILGPIVPNQLNQTEINRSKPTSELILALLLTKLKLGSVYCMAVWAGVPLGAMFEYNKLDGIYQHWIKAHPNDKQGNPFAHTLELQTQNYCEQNQKFLDGLRNQLIQALPEIAKEMSAAGHQVIASTIMDADFLYTLATAIPWVKNATEDPSIQAVQEAGATIFPYVRKLVTMLDVLYGESAFEPPVALGYKGITDSKLKSMNKSLKCKIEFINQTSWLWSHSAMKIPSKALMKNIYEKYIIGSQGMQNYGSVKIS